MKHVDKPFPLRPPVIHSVQSIQSVQVMTASLRYGHKYSECPLRSYFCVFGYTNT